MPLTTCVPSPAVERRRACVLLALAIAAASLATAGVPGWTKKRPVERGYYVGIGSATRSQAGTDFMSVAKNAALADLASEIEVSITGEMSTVATERGGKYEEQVRSQAATRTRADLEGYELVDTYEEDGEYWVYYRLSRAKYEARKQERLATALRLSLDMLARADSCRKQEDVSAALGWYVQALRPLDRYVAEPLEVEYAGKRGPLLATIQNSLGETLSRVTLRPLASPVNVTYGKEMKASLEVAGTFRTDRGDERPLTNVPLRYAFAKGTGDLLPVSKTNAQGVAVSPFSKVSSMERNQLLRVDLHLEGFLSGDTVSTALRQLLGRVAVPSTQIVLNVSALNCVFQSEETNTDGPLKQPYLEPRLKNALSGSGFVFVADRESADYAILVSGSAREGTEMHGQYVSYVDLDVSVRELASGKEVFKNSLTNVKGISLDYPRAGLKAFENAAKKAQQDLVPQIVLAVQR